MRTADLTGALLDYWTARAEGVPADQLEIRQPYPDPANRGAVCFHYVQGLPANLGRTLEPVCYSTNWALGGPLLEKHRFDLLRDFGDGWSASPPGLDSWFQGGDTPLIAICRAVVRAAFGDEVEDLPC